ncbi:hypothetical protein SAMD00019534_078750 [Acytostelium subglobosum LB1]|uniref:hypothetical protein n=1 Tax=Acytostelium subglobosum LB1 TaxID=1410327 RepID=UPI0006448ECA|nr:hypothetical protein SAMD00019534_078750 [Acytostelium subglobosum LB1]GAM24700.1 hypothetical protein SAMD00019534_078750 [Acytostelium subglobosum LB1]|eukprot:XP_012752369.1 hypothetical protein SAMD00019534_078750 [Acytostelium subglobosum LB1]
MDECNGKDNNNSKKNDDDDTLRCLIHNKKQKVICYDCNEIVCTVCMTTEHVKHEVEHVHSIKTQFTSDKRIKRFDGRLDTLWDTLQQLAWSYDTIQISHRRVANQFRELHEFLMMEERRLKKDLDDELDKTTTSINNIINEIANLKAHATHIDEDCDGVDVMNTLVRSIQTSRTLDQFIDKKFKSCGDDVTIGDDQLLDFVRRASQATLAVQVVTKPIRIEYDSHMLERGIVDLIDKYTFDDEPTLIEHGFRNHIFSLWKDSCSMYSLDTGEWTVIDDKYTPRERIFRSVWHNDLEIIGVDGGESISTCYNGDNLIYLVGGYNDDKVLDRIDCFNIDTQQFTSVGRLSVPTRGSYSFLYMDRIIIVGGDVDVECEVSLTDILSFNIGTKECDVLLKTEFHPEEFIIACYDGFDHVFILGDESTLLVNLSTMNSIQGIGMYTIGWPCIYTQSHGFAALSGTGKNERFSELQDKWISLDDNDPVEDRSSFGTCHIYH